MHEEPASLPAIVPASPLPPEAPSQGFERDPKPERRAFNDLAMEVYGQRSVIGADIGINKGALDTYYPHGLLCYLNPYLNQEEGDFVELFCGNDEFPVSFTHVTESQADSGEKIPLFIPHSRLPDGVIQPLFFRLTRASGGNAEETKRYSLMVDTLPPAGPYDPIPSTPWHEGMAAPMPPEFIIQFGVDKESAERGVPITIEPYPLDESAPHGWRMAEHDRIRLFIGGVLVEPVHRVTWDEANNRRPLTITIYYETWAQVGDGQKVLEYEAIDQCGNYSVKWSPQTVLKVDIGNDPRGRLPYAYIDESDLGEEFDTLDYDVLDEGADATLVITQVRYGYQRGDALRITFDGRTADNTTVREVIDYPIPDDQIGRNTELPLRNEIVRELIGGTAVLSYERIRSGSDPHPSEITRLVIIGSLLSRLARPEIREAIGEFIDPAAQQATVDISPYTGQSRTDRIDLYLLGTKANNELEFWHFFRMAGSDTDTVTFTLQQGRDLDIASLNGGTLQVHYRVSGAEAPRESLHATFNIGQATATLPAPNVPEATGGVLDPDSAATLVVPRAANLEEDDRLSVYWQGSKPGGSYTYRQFPVTAAWLDTDIPFPIDQSYVEANRGGSIKVFYIVERGREPVRYSHARQFRVGETLNLVRPEVLQADAPGHLLNPMNALNVASIRVRYDGMSNADSIQVDWEGVPGEVGSPVIAPKPGNAAQGYVDFSVAGRTVGMNVGQSVRVSYEVTRDGMTLPSEPLDLRVLNFSEVPDDPLLPGRPRILQAANSGEGTELNLGSFSSNATCRIDSTWPLIAIGQDVWLRLKGTRTDGAAHNLNIWVPPGPKVSSAWLAPNFYYEVAARRDYFNELKDGTDLTLEFKVDFSQSADESRAQTFPLRTYRVNAAPLAAPTITSVQDASGGNIANNSTVVTATVTLSGTAAVGQQVEIRDGGALMDTVTATNGTWTTRALNVTNKAYSIKARGLYGNNPESTARTFTVSAATAPTITSVRDASGGNIANNSTVVTATVTLTGTAVAGQQVQIRDGGALMDTVTATNGTWTTRALNVTRKTYSIKARGLYGSPNPESAARTFTVIDEVKPVITGVHTSSGAPVPHNGTTDQTSLTLSGTATRNSTIEVRDNANVVLSTRVTDSGAWMEHIHNLSEKKYNLIAKIVGGTLSSDTRSFTVSAATAPTITSVRDASGGNIANNSTVVTATVTLTGTAVAGQQVEIRDGSTRMTTVTATNGTWTTAALNVTSKAYSIKARGLYGSPNPESAARTFTVTELITPTLDTVRDPWGNQIISGSYTPETVFTLTGTASKRQQVRIEDGYGTTAENLGTVTADANGRWTFTTNSRPVGSRRLYVKSLYHSGNVYSNTREFTIRPLSRPTITRVYDQRMNPVENGGSSRSWFFGGLEGTATAGSGPLRLKVNDWDGQIFINADNTWSKGGLVFGNANTIFTITAYYQYYPDIQSAPYIVRNAP